MLQTNWLADPEQINYINCINMLSKPVQRVYG